ncbi:MBOAT family protein [Myxococcota bacterium]|nr:MBOAT family protein [Myxococcota bacterium]MBU1411325.1 MBOAT family protein [Myxococcota bacterium]MBU1509124.1 MBOAT family protein [Myxococcota bacterium]
MLFNSVAYLLFFLVVFWGFWALVRRPAFQRWLLLAASLFFYGFWNPAYLSLILGVIVVTWVCAARIRTDPDRKGLYLIAGVGASLLVLAIFKYTWFSLSSLEILLDIFDASLPFSIAFAKKIVLPVGISFYTFQSLSYLVDVYRGHLEPEPSPVRYALYVSFFPQLVAGPIVRAVDFLPQLDRPRELTDAQAARAMSLIAIGLFKKIVIADFLAINLVDRVFDTPEMMSSPETVAGIYGYTLQIFCDFSAYSDIAIGSALLLGFHLPENFNAPFLAQNLSDFWRRWHISLSSWLRDYLYIPLGGSRCSAVRTQVNLAITMLLGGLWHGPAWTFVFWGFLHGAGLVIMRTVGWHRPATSWPSRILRTAVTFHFVVFAFVFFRAGSFSRAMTVLGRALDGPSGLMNLPWTVALVLSVGFLFHGFPRTWTERGVAWFSRLWSPVQAGLILGFAFFLQKVASTDVVPFIYFQF